MSLVPREQRFYDHFEKQASILVSAGALLKETFDGAGILVAEVIDPGKEVENSIEIMLGAMETPTWRVASSVRMPATRFGERTIFLVGGERIEDAMQEYLDRNADHEEDA